MASPEPTSRKYHARDLIAYSDAELDQYLKEHNQGDAIMLKIEDPRNLPQSFFQRLRYLCLFVSLFRHRQMFPLANNVSTEIGHSP